MKKREIILYTVCGAFLLGMLWRMRGTHGWGSGWGVLASGFVFLLFLTAVLRRPQTSGFPALCLTAFSFMLTTPGWGTLLDSLTGVLTVRSKASEETLQAFVSPVSAIVLMLCLGFGLASVYAVLTGKYLGGKRWRILDYIVLLVVFVAVGELCKAAVSHVLLRVIEPQAATLFAEGLQKAGIEKSVYAAYMSHYGNMSWANKIIGGRHYFACVSTIAFALQAVSVLLTTRFFIGDKYASRVGAVICGSFAFSITVSDVFFYISDGGYRMQQGLSLPENIAAWSTWEYCTGFLAGGLITAYLLCSKPEAQQDERRDGILERFTFLQNQKLRNTVAFLLCFVAGIGANTVRPILLRLDESAAQIPATIVTAAAVLVISVLLCKKFGVLLRDAEYPKFAGILCFCISCWYAVLYFVFPDAQIKEIQWLHNQLALCSFVVTCIGFLLWRKSYAKSTK